MKINTAKCWKIPRDYSTYEVTMNDTNGQSAGKNLAWLAGFLEGDGSVGISKHQGKKRLFLVPYIRYTNTDALLIEHCYNLLDELDITYYLHSKETKNGTAWELSIKGFKRVPKFLELIVSELHGKKKKRAELVLEWIKSRESVGNNVTYSKRELEIYEQIKMLNDPGYPQRLHAVPLHEGEDIVRTVQKCAELSRNAIASL